MNFLETTKKYYAEWLDCVPIDFWGSIKYICTSKRDVKPSFYPKPYPLYICRTEQSTIVSYSPKLQNSIDIMKIDESVLHQDSIQLVSYLEKLFEAKIIHNIKFVFDKAADYPADNVFSLKKDDYHLFFKIR